MRWISSKLQSMRPIISFSFLMLITVSVSWGRPADLPPSSDVIVTITPPTATIRVGGTIDLQGEVTGLSDPLVAFWIEEEHDRGVDAPICDHSNPDWTAGCRFGYLTGGEIQNSALLGAKYQAPPTPGTYHVTFRAVQKSVIDFFEWFDKRATATIVVTY